MFGELYYYRNCASQVIQLNASLPAFHTISYEGSVTTALRLHYHSLPIVVEKLFVNESIDIKHSRGHFQRTFVIDAYKAKLSVSFNVRKFFGSTDFCGYGGIRMFNQVHMYTTVHRQIRYAYVSNSNVKNKLYQQFIKNTSYNPICINDSLFFKSKFHLDFGKTYFVFYDFSPIWNIDVTLNVHSSNYNALYDFEHSYCSHPEIQAYVFNDYILNCYAVLIKLTRQVPFILQWSRESRSLVNKEEISLQCFWPGIMDLTINQNLRNFQAFNSEKELCTPNQIFRIAGVSNISTVLIGTTTQSQTISNAESFMVASAIGNCNAMDQTSYAVILNPSLRNDQCILSDTDFTVGGSSEKTTNYKTASKDCLSLDATLTTSGIHAIYLIEQSFNIPLQDNWIYYSVTINEGCVKSAEMIIYFITAVSTFSRYVHFEFPELQKHHVFYDFGNLRFLQFYLERFSLDCAAYIEFTSSARKKFIPLHRKRLFKVYCIFLKNPKNNFHMTTVYGIN